MRRVIVHPLAKAELGRAARRYNAELFGLGERLVGMVRETLFLIAESPELFQRDDMDPTVRRAVLPPRMFPYKIFYSVQDDAIVVYAIAHATRRPTYWHRRREYDAE